MRIRETSPLGELVELISRTFLSGSAAGVDQQRQGLRTRFPDEPMVQLVSDHSGEPIAWHVHGTR